MTPKIEHISILDFFAAAALQGYCANSCYDWTTKPPKDTARIAYAQVYAMLAEKERSLAVQQAEVAARAKNKESEPNKPQPPPRDPVITKEYGWFN